MEKIMRFLKLASLVASLLVLSSCGGGGGGGSTSTGNKNATAIQGKLAVAAGDSATKYTVFNSNQTSTPSSAGSFSTAVGTNTPTYTYAISDTGNKVYAAMNNSTDGSVTINAQSTAEALVLLSPLLIPGTSAERTNIINIVKADAAVKALAAVIDSVYGSVANPMADTRISDALTSAVTSVLTSWQASNASSAKALRQTMKSFALARINSASGSSSVQIMNYDMATLTLANSTGSTLNLGLNTASLGLTTNVDWVVRIVELDPAKIIGFQGVPILGNPSNIDSMIKVGGYDQKTIIEGAVASGLLKFAVDPLGSVATSFGDIVFPDSGIVLPHDGVYAVIALSGSPFGDTPEYNSVLSSPWQVSQSAEAATINIGAAAIDVIGVGTVVSG